MLADRSAWVQCMTVAMSLNMAGFSTVGGCFTWSGQGHHFKIVKYL